MDGDTIMDDADRSNYPPPDSTQREPYPSLSQSFFQSPRTPPPPYSAGRPILRPLPSPSSLAYGNGGFTSLSDYFNLDSSNANQSRPATVESTPTQRRESRFWYESGQRRFSRDSPPPTSASGSSLPGFHILPDVDGLDDGPDNDEPPGPSATSSGSSDSQRGRGSVRGSGRSRGSTRGSGRGRKGWKWAVKGTEHDKLFKKTRLPRGAVGKKRGPKGPRGNANLAGEHWVDPGEEFKKLQGQATESFLEGDYEAALDYAKMAVQKNSEVWAAHKLIRDIYSMQGKTRDAVVASWVGANTMRNPRLWAEVADNILALQDDDCQPNDLEWAMECYHNAINLDRNCYEARVGKVRLHEVRGELDSARLECKAVAQKWPEDLEHVFKYADFCLTTPNYYDWERAKEAYEAAFEKFRDTDMLGHNADEQWAHLNLYLEVLLKLGLYQQGITQLRRMSRWFLGRKEDSFWDGITDDREYDYTDERRLHLLQFQLGRVTRDSSLYGDGLPAEIRGKLGVFRLRMGSMQEALKHFESLQRFQDQAENCQEVFLFVAEALTGYAMFGEAIKFFEVVKDLQDLQDQKFWMAIAQCYNAIERHADAEAAFMTVVDANEYNVDARVQLARLYDTTGQTEKTLKMADQVIRLGRSDVARKQKLPTRKASLKYPKYDATNGYRAIMPKPVVGVLQSDTTPGVTLLPNGPIENGDDHREIENLYASIPETEPGVQDTASAVRDISGPNQRQWNLAPVSNTVREPVQTLDQKSLVHDHYAAMNELWQTVENDESEEAAKQWMHHARSMIAEFTKVGAFNPTTASRREKSRKQPSSLSQALLDEMEKLIKRSGGVAAYSGDDLPVPKIDENIGGGFLDIPFSEWHRITCNLALLYAKFVDELRCAELLRDCLLEPIPYQRDPELVDTTLAVCMYCALAFNDTRLMVKIAREYVFKGRKRSDMAMQLLAASGRLSYAYAPFHDQYISKWVHELADGRTASGQPENGERTNKQQDDLQSLLLTICGNINNHRQHGNANPALPYLLRALALQPENLVINLSIATTYITQATANAKEGRPYDVAQGLAFLYRYRDLRIASGKACDLQEAEYNVARTFHQLGLMHLAVPAYERVLQLNGEVQKEYAEGDVCDGMDTENFSMEAVFALQSIYLSAGNVRAARAITEDWLVM